MVDVDIGLIVVSVIIPVVLVFFNLVVLAHYVDPQAAAGHFIGKLMIMLGMLIAECTVMLLPLDVGNKAGAIGCGYWNNNCGGLQLTLVWQIAYCIIAGMVVVIIPFFIFYYENDDEGMEAREKGEDIGSALSLRFAAFKRSFCAATVYTILCVIFALIGFLVLYHYIATTKIPYKQISVSIATGAFMPVGTPYGVRPSACPATGTCLCTFANSLGQVVNGGLCPCGAGAGCKAASSTLSMDVSYVVFLAACISFLGWVLFSLYVGIGFVALPLDCINAFVHRPKLLSTAEARNQRRALMKKSEELIKVGEEMANRLIEAQDNARNKSERKRAGKVHKTELNRYKLLVDMLEKDLEEFQLGDPENYRQHYNPFVPFFKLGAGIVSIAVSLAWVVHIIVYMLFSPAVYPMLNNYLSFFDGFFPLFGTLTIGVFGLYLLLAASKGVSKFGTRFFLIEVHPLEPGKTLLNSFMFNVQLVLLCVLPTVQFCTDAFSGYARYTEADVIFGSQMKYIEGFRYLWQYNVFLFTLLIMFGLSLIYFSCRPSDRKHLNKVMAEIKRSKAGELKAFERKLNQQGGALSAVRVQK